jgi:hypothetical protein
MIRMLGLLAAVCFPAFAAEEVPGFLIGHNFTPTSYTLPKGHLTAGNYAVAYGLTDELTIGTSPWMIVAYNMPMIEVKYGFETRGFLQRLSFDFNYFKTFQYGFNRLQQESTFLRVTATHKFTSWYTLHLCAAHQYFIDATRAFSLRLIPGNGSRTNLQFTTLNEFHVTRNIGFFVELGLVGLTYSVPWTHWGLSAFVSGNWGLFQFGLSRTASLAPVPVTGDGWLANFTFGHPEIQLQILI